MTRTMMDFFPTNRPFYTSVTNNNYNGSFIVPGEQYSNEQKIEISGMIEKYGLLTSSASKTCVMENIAQEGKVSVAFVGKIYNRLALARHKSQELGRGTHNLSEADEHCLVYLYKMHPFRDVQSYIDNLFLITGTLAHSSAIFLFFKPLQVFVPSFPSLGALGHSIHQDENFPPSFQQTKPAFPTIAPQANKMPDASMISSFSRCGISSSRDGNKKRALHHSALRRPQDYNDSDRPRVRRRYSYDSQEDPPSLSSETATTVSTTSTASMVVYQPPSASGGIMIPHHHQHSPMLDPSNASWVPRPPPALYNGGNPQSPTSWSNHYKEGFHGKIIS